MFVEIISNSYEEWRQRMANRKRNIQMNFYVPLMMMASKAADELSIASVTRGIENPNPRTCLVQIKCGIADWMAMLIAVAFFIFELCMRGGVTG
jgi:energy-coupling factor transporter transmembrane protein EcfT